MIRNTTGYFKKLLVSSCLILVIELKMLLNHIVIDDLSRWLYDSARMSEYRQYTLCFASLGSKQ
jgi:hypothetical protein